jgi:hypothetical protein
MVAKQEPSMDRPYYGLKALLVGTALLAAAYCSAVGCQHLLLAGNPNYQAASMAEAQVRDAGLELVRNIGRLFGHSLARL